MTVLYIASQLLLLVSLGGLIWLVVVAFKRSALWGIGVLFLSPITALIYSMLYWQESKKPFGMYATTLAAGLVSLAVVFSSWGGFAVMDAAMNLDDRAGDEQAAFDFANASLNFIENADDSQAQDVGAMRDFINAMEAGTPDEAACRIYQHALRNEQDPETRRLVQRNMREIGCAAQPAPGASTPAATDYAQTRSKFTPKPREERVRYQQVFKPIDLAGAAAHVGRPVVVTRNGGKPQECKLLAIDSGKLVFEQRIGSGTVTFSYRDREISALEGLFTVAES